MNQPQRWLTPGEALYYMLLAFGFYFIAQACANVLVDALAQ